MILIYLQWKVLEMALSVSEETNIVELSGDTRKNLILGILLPKLRSIQTRTYSSEFHCTKVHAVFAKEYLTSH
jgi:hypothetical protein